MADQLKGWWMVLAGNMPHRSAGHCGLTCHSSKSVLQQPGWQLMPQGPRFPTPTWAGFWGRSAHTAEFKIICCHFTFPSPAIPPFYLQAYVSQKVICFCRRQPVTFPPFWYPALWPLRGSPAVITWVDGCCFAEWRTRRCEPILVSVVSVLNVHLAAGLWSAALLEGKCVQPDSFWITAACAQSRA